MTDTTLEVRFARGGSVEGRQLVGLAAPFGTITHVGDFREVFAPGAFDASLASGADIIALADHDPARVLGRTRSATLALRSTPEGLQYSLQLPDTTTGNDLRVLAARGDLGGVSVGMIVKRDRWNGDLRTIDEAELHEISIVQAHPAYPTTTVSLRSRQSSERDQLGVLRLFLETCR